jgi:outer membrane receptor protein involved in Fe transport
MAGKLAKQQSSEGSPSRVVAACVLSVLALGASASATSSEAAGEGSSSGELQEIIVSAQKRDESINKVPISVEVYGRDEMQERNIKDLADVAAVAPGVDYQNQGSFNDFAIRGISASISGASTTGIYLDDVPVAIRLDSGVVVSTNTTPLVFDLDRVEVLRGPQGTLFGAGAEGGAIRFIQAQPSLTESSGFARAGVATTDNGGASYEAGAAYGAPIIQDELGFRVSAWHGLDGGYVDHESAIPGGAHTSNSGWRDSDVFRMAVTYAPFESLKITPSYFYQRVYWNDEPTFDPGSRTYPDTMTENWSSLNPTYSNVSGNRLVFQGFLLQPSTDTLSLPSLKIEQKFSDIDLTSSTSYFNRHYNGEQDFTTSMALFAGLPWPTTANAAAESYTPSTQNVFTQEIRAQSANPDQRLQWTFGLFYNDARQMNIQYLVSPYFPTQVQQGFGESIEQVFGQPLLPGGVSIYEKEPDTDTQLAAYGQLTYQIIQHVSLLAGARVARETDKYSIYISGPLNGPNTTAFSGKEEQTVVDPKYGVNIQLDDRNLIYFSAAKGDRIGGVNPPPYNFAACLAALDALGYPNGAGLSTYKGDSLWSYEIGSKNRLFDGRLQIETSAFHINWNDVQQNQNVPTCQEGFTLNRGKATSNGFDFQAQALLTDALKVGLSAGYTNARDATTIYSGGNPVISKGQQINPYSAPWIVVPSAEYRFPIAEGHKGYLRLQDAYHSKNPGPYNPNDNPANPANILYFIPNPSYNQLDIHLGMTWGGWDTSVYALNVANSHPLLYNQAQYPSTFVGSVFTLRPLTIGFTTMYHW